MFKSIGDIFKQNSSTRTTNAKKLVYQEAFDFLSLVDCWDEIAGKTLGKHTAPVKLKKGTLYLVSKHPAFSEQVSFMEEMIKRSIFKRFPILKDKIRSLYYVVNSARFDEVQELIQKRTGGAKETKESALPHKHSPEYKLLKARADELFADLDEETKELMTSIYIQSQFKK